MATHAKCSLYMISQQLCKIPLQSQRNRSDTLQHLKALQQLKAETSKFFNKQSVKDFQEKISKAITWYSRITGFDQVEMAQNRVLDNELKFMAAQERRRQVNLELSAIHNKLREVHEELDKTSRGESRYLNLITDEHKLLGEERFIKEKFNLAESEEREIFMALSSSLKTCHEKQRLQADRTKYWGIILSVAGTLIGIIGTSLNNHYKMKEFKNIINESLNGVLVGNLHDYVGNIEKKVDKYISYREEELDRQSKMVNNTRKTPAPALAQEILKPVPATPTTQDVFIGLVSVFVVFLAIKSIF